MDLVDGWPLEQWLKEKGKLEIRDAARVEDALKRNPALARQYEAVREELAEAIHLNENLGAPSSRALDKLFAAIDAEPVRKPVSYTHLRAHETVLDLVCRLLLEKKNTDH